MTTTEKLNAIADKCRALLMLAKKRTKIVKWIPKRNHERYKIVWIDKATGYSTCDLLPPDADFIAACAGAAESGWRTTLAAIAALDGMGARGAAVLGDAIIAAWEGLL